MIRVCGRGPPETLADISWKLKKSVQVPHRGTDEHEYISEEFFSGLPADSFSPDETNLRDNICRFIEDFRGSGFATLSTMCQDKELNEAKCALLPRGVSLKEWIETRCGEDFDLVLNRSNQNCIGFAGSLDSEEAAMSKTERQPGSSRSKGSKAKGSIWESFGIIWRSFGNHLRVELGSIWSSNPPV